MPTQYKLEALSLWLVPAPVSVFKIEHEWELVLRRLGLWPFTG